MVVADVEQKGAAAVEGYVCRQGEGLPPPCQVGHARIELGVLVILITGRDGTAIVIVDAGLGDKRQLAIEN